MNLKDITYYVPTRGRTHRKPLTLLELEKIDLLDRVVICSPLDEVGFWKDRFPKATVVADPPEVVERLYLKRVWMFEHCQTKYFWMFDDDLTFRIQYDDRSTWLVDDDLKTFHEDITEHLLELFQQYDTVTLGWREFSNVRAFLVEIYHCTRTWGYEKEKVRKDLEPAFGRSKFYLDTDWCLTLLEAGHKNVTTSNLVVSARKEAGKPEDGGIGIYRTPEGVRESGEQLLRLHPEHISVNRRDNNHPDFAQSGRFTIHWRKLRKKFARGEL